MPEQNSIPVTAAGQLRGSRFDHEQRFSGPSHRRHRRTHRSTGVSAFLGGAVANAGSGHGSTPNVKVGVQSAPAMKPWVRPTRRSTPLESRVTNGRRPCRARSRKPCSATRRRRSPGSAVTCSHPRRRPNRSSAFRALDAAVAGGCGGTFAPCRIGTTPSGTTFSTGFCRARYHPLVRGAGHFNLGVPRPRHRSPERPLGRWRQ